jgi:hypothetical protein
LLFSNNVFFLGEKSSFDIIKSFEIDEVEIFGRDFFSVSLLFKIFSIAIVEAVDKDDEFLIGEGFVKFKFFGEFEEFNLISILKKYF